MKILIAFILAIILGIALGVATASLRLVLTPWEGNPPVIDNTSSLKSPY
jgi:hypothetical protein